MFLVLLFIFVFIRIKPKRIATANSKVTDRKTSINLNKTINLIFDDK